MTPRQRRRQRTADWNQAIREGRLVRFAGLGRFEMFLTAANAEQAVRDAQEDGIEANVVDPKEAQ